MTSLNDGPVCSGPDTMTAIPTTGGSNYGFRTSGNTFRMVTPRSITLADTTGSVGEICWGPVTILGITQYYIFVCVATDTWRATALSNLPI